VEKPLLSWNVYPQRPMNSICRTFLLSVFCYFAVASAFGQQSAPAIPTKPAPPSGDMKMMQRIEDQWDDALAKRDQYALELVLSPQFIDISSTGEVTTRNQQIARLFLKEGSTIPKLEQKVVTVRMFGDISLVNGTYSLQKKENGALVEERGVFTHVYQRVRTNWQCINSQRTIVVEEDLTKPKKKSSSSNKPPSSPAELPMHVPLIYKGADTAPAAQPAPQK
jgi:ketosteroid isomerase-like protein